MSHALLIYRAALLAASAVATASRSLRTDATREECSDFPRSASLFQDLPIVKDDIENPRRGGASSLQRGCAPARLVTRSFAHSFQRSIRTSALLACRGLCVDVSGSVLEHEQRYEATECAEQGAIRDSRGNREIVVTATVAGDHTRHCCPY